MEREVTLSVSTFGPQSGAPAILAVLFADRGAERVAEAASR